MLRGLGQQGAETAAQQVKVLVPKSDDSLGFSPSYPRGRRRIDSHRLSSDHHMC